MDCLALTIILNNQDIYEFVQRRNDWKRIEKEVDRTMYNLSWKGDCIIC
jgi:recyclin-1